jgi:hypothetical protein
VREKHHRREQQPLRGEQMVHFFEQQRSVTMSVPVGTWNVVTNLNDAVLVITNVDGQGNVTGTYQPDQSETYNITGTWNAATNELSFSYTFTINIRWFHEYRIVSFQGYFFQAGQPLFNQSPGPVSPAAWNMIAGTYTVGPLFFGTTAPNYGWVARSQI